jgi:hypothetical protein
MEDQSAKKISIKPIENMQNNTPDQNFEKTGLSLPPAPSPIGLYNRYVMTSAESSLKKYGEQKMV